jgi:hypothetical protein
MLSTRQNDLYSPDLQPSESWYSGMQGRAPSNLQGVTRRESCQWLVSSQNLSQSSQQGNVPAPSNVVGMLTLFDLSATTCLTLSQISDSTVRQIWDDRVETRANYEYQLRLERQRCSVAMVKVEAMQRI